MDDDLGTVRWFGESWGAPINEPETHVPNPVDTKCLDCGRYIESDDQGIRTVASLSLDPTGYAHYHFACWMRMLGLDEFGKVVPCE